MIKLVDILKEIAGEAGGIWYHGSTADIDLFKEGIGGL